MSNVRICGRDKSDGFHRSEQKADGVAIGRTLKTLKIKKRFFYLFAPIGRLIADVKSLHRQCSQTNEIFNAGCIFYKPT